jgi:NAD(P)-dependent dehydrogenase (short-subunit alcohol dehydrogenase family)
LCQSDGSAAAVKSSRIYVAAHGIVVLEMQLTPLRHRHLCQYLHDCLLLADSRNLFKLEQQTRSAMNDAGRIALVTGVGKSTGIGFELCRKLAGRNFEVVLTARKPEAARALAARLNEDFPGRVMAQPLDVTRSEDVDVLHDAIVGRFGKLDVLINNAAAVSPYGERGETADLTNARTVLDATLFGTWNMCQKFLPLIRNSAQGRIVNVSSGAGSHGDMAFGLTTSNQMGASYAIAKAALNALTVKLAVEETTPTVRINAVCPGFTTTFEGGDAMGARPVADGAESVLWAADISNTGPTGGFFRDGKPLAW